MSATDDALRGIQNAGKLIASLQDELCHLERERDLWKAEAERWREIKPEPEPQ